MTDGCIKPLAGLALLLAFCTAAGAQGPAISTDGDRTPVALEDLVAVALERALPLLSGRIEPEIAAAGLQSARDRFDPELTASGERAETLGMSTRSAAVGIRQEVPALGTELGLALATQETRPSAGATAADHTTDLSLTLSQPLLKGFGIAGADVNKAHLNLSAARLRLDRLLDQVAAEVELAYWDLAEAEAVEAVARQSLAVADSLWYRNRELHKRRLVSELDVLTAESGQALRTGTLIDANRARIDAEEALIFLAYGESAGEQLASQGPLRTVTTAADSMWLPLVETAVADALARRADVASARDELQQVEIDVQVRRNGLLPALDLRGKVGAEGVGPDLGTSFDGDSRERTWSVGFALSYRLPGRGDRAEYADARLRLRRSRLILAGLEQAVQREVREGYRAMEFGRQRQATAVRAAELANRQLTAEHRRLDLGLSDPFRVLEVEENATAANLAAARARFSLARAITKYSLSSGQIR